VFRDDHQLGLNDTTRRNRMETNDLRAFIDVDKDTLLQARMGWIDSVQQIGIQMRQHYSDIRFRGVDEGSSNRVLAGGA
jgi:hypothetical protein